MPLKATAYGQYLQQSMDQPGMVDIPVRRHLNLENILVLQSSFAPDNLV